MRIAIIGTGYVGLTAGACFAHLGHTVTCIDKDRSKIEQLQQGKVPIYEPGIEQLMHDGVADGKLTFTDDLQSGINNAEVIFLCVGTPSRSDGTLDLSALREVGLAIAKQYRQSKAYAVIVEKSTVPVQTAQWLKDILKRHNCPCDVAVNPEFLREGSAIEDFPHPDRIVIGAETSRVKEVLTKLYASFSAPIIYTDLASAELIKHVSNAFLAMKISYANLVAQLCDKVNADVQHVMKGVGMDQRIGRAFLNAGIGYGGSCFPKDLDAFIAAFKANSISPMLLESVREINTGQRGYFVQKVRSSLGSLHGKTIGILGLAFKPHTDDMRYAPSIDIINALQREGCIMKAYDPQAMETAKRVLPKGVLYCTDPYAAAADTDAVLILTEWPEFTNNLNLKKLRACTSVIIDGRNCLEPQHVEALGFDYVAIGRRSGAPGQG